MHISKTEDSKDSNNKPIGKRLDPNRRLIFTQGVAPSTVALIVIVTALLAFVAGARSENYAQIGNVLRGGSVSENLPEDIDYSSVEKLYDRLKQTYDGELNYAAILDGLKKGLTGATGDPYTTYLNPEQAASFKDDLNGTFSGIGAEIGREGEFVIIVAPLEGYPAEEAGLKSRDVILRIDGVDAIGWSIEEAVLKIRGEEDTAVELTVLRGSEKIVFTVFRQTIVIPSVSYQIVNQIGVLRISRFSEDTFRLARSAALEFIDQQVKGVVLDMRSNSGGYLTSAIDVSGIWLDDQIVVEQRSHSGAKTIDDYKASRGSLLGKIPTAVLIDGGSASASEIVAGALKDHGYAHVVGVNSYGKGSVQNLEQLTDGGVLKVTVARWHRPSGESIDQIGVAPDLVVEFDESSGQLQIDNQLQAAIDFLLK